MFQSYKKNGKLEPINQIESKNLSVHSWQVLFFIFEWLQRYTILAI